MILKQLQYFIAVVDCGSFTGAADRCYISQSAISQQIKALEDDLGFPLLERKGRSFALTPAGEYFYQKSVMMVTEYEQYVREASRIANQEKAELNIAYLRSFETPELKHAVSDFAAKYPDVTVRLFPGNHEEVFTMIRNGTADMNLNDLRRAFSDAYSNFKLGDAKVYAAVSARSPLASLERITVPELRHINCIIISSKEAQADEEDYFRNVFGLKSEIVFAENIEEAQLMASAGRGFYIPDGIIDENDPVSLKYIPVYEEGEPLTRSYYAFWKLDNSGWYVEEFADILKAQFEQ